VISAEGAPLCGAPEPAWRWADHARWVCDGDVVFVLDLRTDRYLSVPAEALAPSAGANPTLKLLMDSGLVGSFQDAPKHRVQTRRGRAKAGPGDVFGACLWARGVMKGRALAHAVSVLRVGQASGASRPIVEAFQRWRIYYPRDISCLFDALALGRLLFTHGIGVELVFAVRARPFSAHCWLESDGAVLNDDPEYCATFLRMRGAGS
jgi:hypothetical protein